MLKLSFWPPTHLFLVKNQKIIKNLFIILYLSVIIFIFTGFYLFSLFPDIYLSILKVSSKFGTIALFLFLSTLLPGTFQRFKILPLFTASLILFRRQIGILMYLVALTHSMYISTIPVIMSRNFSLENLPSNGLTGVLTLSILFPVWITSNDYSQKKFGKFWKTLQRLTYLAMITIFLHVALIEKSAAILVAIVFVLELSSWLKVWFFTKKI